VRRRLVLFPSYKHGNNRQIYNSGQWDGEQPEPVLRSKVSYGIVMASYISRELPGRRSLWTSASFTFLRPPFLFNFLFIVMLAPLLFFLLGVAAAAAAPSPSSSSSASLCSSEGGKGTGTVRLAMALC
jgi:hypothetical protein